MNQAWGKRAGEECGHQLAHSPSCNVTFNWTHWDKQVTSSTRLKKNQKMNRIPPCNVSPVHHTTLATKPPSSPLLGLQLVALRTMLADVDAQACFVDWHKEQRNGWKPCTINFLRNQLKPVSEVHRHFEHLTACARFETIIVARW